MSLIWVRTTILLILLIMIVGCDFVGEKEEENTDLAIRSDSIDGRVSVESGEDLFRIIEDEQSDSLDNIKGQEYLVWIHEIISILDSSQHLLNDEGIQWKKENWRYIEVGDSIKSYFIEGWREDVWYSEQYLLFNDELVYVMEEEQYGVDPDLSTYRNFEHFIKEDFVVEVWSNDMQFEGEIDDDLIIDKWESRIGDIELFHNLLNE